MGNQFLDVVLPAFMDEVGARVSVECALAQNCYTGYEKVYAGYGEQIQVQLPPYFNAVEFNGTQTPQDIKNLTVPITMSNFPTVPLAIGDKDMTLNVDDFKLRYMDAMVDAIKTYIEVTGHSQIYKQIWSTAGTPGSPPDSYAKFLQSVLFLEKYGAIKANRCSIIESSAEQAILGNQTSGLGLLNINDPAYSQKLLAGAIGQLKGIPLYTSEAVATHTAGNVTSGQSIQVNANVAEDATTIALKGFTASTGSLKAGDVFTIAGVYSINYAKRASTGLLQRFVVQEDVTANSSGVLTVTVEPRVTSLASTSIYQQYPNVSSLPLENAVVTVLTAGTANGQTSSQNIIFQKNAIALVSADLVQPMGNVWSYSTPITKDTPIRIRATAFYDWNTKTNQISVDCLFGFKVLSPWFCARLLG